MKKIWWVNPDNAQALVSQFSSLEMSRSVNGEFVTKSPLSHVVTTYIEGSKLYIKRYKSPGRKLRKYLGRSRLKAEWENLLLFASLGIPVPEIVSFGETRQLAHYHGGCLVTKELPGVYDLATIAQQHKALLDNRDWLLQIIDKVADYTARLHQSGFIHNDLKWRNILVTMEEEPEVYFIDCPAGKIKSIWTRRRGIIKDLACLDKVAKYRLSNSMRLRFFKKYLKINKLTSENKKMIRKVINFFKEREYIKKEWKQILENNGLFSFDDIWSKSESWVEEPNFRRGGMSGVAVYELALPSGDTTTVFIKKQENHCHRTLSHPIHGVPTLQRELKNIVEFTAHNIPTLEPILYLKQGNGKKQRAILITKKLDGYQSLEALTTQWCKTAWPAYKLKQEIIHTIANVVARMHRTGYCHNCLYAKHIFIKIDGDEVKVKLLDLEKAEKRYPIEKNIIRDLSALDRHTASWTLKDRMFFYKAYLQALDKTSNKQKIMRALKIRYKRKSRGASS